MIAKILIIINIILITILFFTIENKLEISEKIVQQISDNKESYLVEQEYSWTEYKLQDLEQYIEDQSIDSSEINSIYLDLVRINQVGKGFSSRSKFSSFTKLNNIWSISLEFDGYSI